MTKTITMKFYYDNVDEELLSEKEFQEKIKENVEKDIEAFNEGRYDDSEADFYDFVEQEGYSYHEIFIIASNPTARTKLLENFTIFLDKRWEDCLLDRCDVYEKEIEVKI